MKPRKRRPPRSPIVVVVEDLRYVRLPALPCVLVHCSECCPSLNRITSMIPIQRAHEARRWVSAVADACRASGLSLRVPVRITAAYHWRDRLRRDLWNYPPKWAVDGLVSGGLIPDDNSEAVTSCDIRFYRTRETAHRMTLRIEEVPLVH